MLAPNVQLCLAGPVTDANALVQSALAAANAARQRGDRVAEGEALRRALAARPDDAFVNNSLGLFELRGNNPAAARGYFTAAIAGDPKEASLCLNLAIACRAAGDVAAERLALGQALDINRLYFPALLAKAELEERHGRPSDGAIAWNAVIQVARQIPDPAPAVGTAIQRGTEFLARHAAALDGQYAALFGVDRSEQPEMRRFARMLDLVLGKARVYRNECHGLYFPFLPADEYFDRSHFPWFAALEAATPAIRAEALALVADPGPALRPYVQLDPGSPPTKWSNLDQSLDWGACFLWEYGNANQPVLDRCPATTAALAQTPLAPIAGKAPSAFFSILRAGAHIPPHTGVTNTRAIIHLPLVVPPGCEFRVGSETRAWEEGKAFAFDDTIEHEAINGSDQDRIILIFDVWNPHLTPAEQDWLIQFYAHQD
jgi:aspartyl/asparaginyl beta-hydroxylase (cupin superfamily)